MRVAEPIVVSEEVRRKLEHQSRGRSTQARVVLRSRIVLLAAEGLQNKQIAAALNVAPRMAALWRGRFIEQGIEGLLKDAPRPGRSESISRATLIEKTTQSTPATAPVAPAMLPAILAWNPAAAWHVRCAPCGVLRQGVL